MNPAIWSELAGLIESNYDTVDGFVILHGSDTMSLPTASVMSFMLENPGQASHLYRLATAHQRGAYGCKGKFDDGHRDRDSKKT